MYLDNSSYKEVWVGFHHFILLLFDWCGNGGQSDSAHVPDVLRDGPGPQELAGHADYRQMDAEEQRKADLRKSRHSVRVVVRLGEGE